MRKKVLFIVNPIAGGRNKKQIPELIKKHIDNSKFEYQIVFSEYVHHAYILSKKAQEEDYDIVVAVGGDGTVNEVAKGIVGTTILFGIIPLGSGNGLARALHIPLKPIKALKLFNNLHTDRIDSATINGEYFFNVAGIGFDAHISHVFSKNKKRGFLEYIKIAFNELKNYQPNTYNLSIDNHNLIHKAFIISIANSPQYGNDAHIAPNADLKDGLLNIVVVLPFPWYVFPFLVMRMFRRTANKSAYVKAYTGKNITITKNQQGIVHLDGEPCIIHEDLQIVINPHSLTVIIP